MAILIIRDKELWGHSTDVEIYGVLAFPNTAIRQKAVKVIENVMEMDGWDIEDMWDALSEFPYEFEAFDDYEEMYI